MATPSLTSTTVVPPNPTTVRGQSAKLSLSPKGDRLVYCNGRSVIVRPVPGSIVETPSSATIIYSQHPQPVTVARISPSGAYVASADQSGTVRIWDILGTEQILKAEYKPFAGVVRDLAWDSESKRIAVVGQGKERFGHFFFMETGSSCGEVSGHAKVINSVALKSTRPFKAVTASDDTKLVFYAGVPYKFTSTLANHSKFAQSVVYSPDGSHFASAGSDSKINLYNGSTADLTKSFEAAGGGGSLFDLEFAKDNEKLLSVGADGIARLWSLDGTKAAEWDLKQGHPNAGDQLVGVTISGQVGIALNLLGELILFDLAQSGSVKGRYLNPTKAITTGVRVSEKEFLLASWDGNVYRYETSAAGQDWSVSTIEGFKHGGPVVTGLAIDGQGVVYTTGMDDVLRKVRNGKTESSTVPLPAAAKGLAVSSSGDAYVATADSLLALKAGSNSFTATKLASTSPASAVGSSPKGDLIAVGSEDGKVAIFTSSSTSSPRNTLEKNRYTVTAISFSPSGDLIAVGDSTGKILVYSTAVSGELKFNQWVFHTSRITSLDWTQDGAYLVSCSLDTHVYIWSVQKPMRRIEGKNLHAGGVNFVSWLQGTKNEGQEAGVVSAGSDGALKVWSSK